MCSETNDLGTQLLAGHVVLRLAQRCHTLQVTLLPCNILGCCTAAVANAKANFHHPETWFKRAAADLFRPAACTEGQ